MNPIYLDIGNSSFKLAAKDQENNWGILMRGGIHEFGKLTEYINRQEKLSGIIYSSVRKDVKEKLESGFQHIQLYSIHSGLIPPEYLNYDTPETLGIDRFLACFGAVHDSGNSVIVIDAGTACTIDYMTAQGVFDGGVILPGITVLKKSMKELLPELPPASELKKPGFPGKSTLDCISIGLYDGFAATLKEFINRFRQLDKSAGVYVTGGDSSLVRSLIGSEVSVQEKEFLLFEGMESFSQKFSR
ncbi:MAG: type III pantothenate kinase [Balneolaceae bacterium]|nr:MAG: type III pantothenate kinase [Balneolaceae bacterium]